MNKVIVISGGNDGLGKEIVKLLSPKHTVVILAPNKEKNRTTAKELKCEYKDCDVSNYPELEKAVNEIISEQKKIDCIINNAGIWIEGEVSENSAEDIKRAFEVNSLGTIYLSKAAIPYLKKQKSGLIINIVSQAGLNFKAKRGIYNSTKWAITGFTKSLQAELAPYNIKVTGIYPGKLSTGLFRKVGIEKDMSNALSPSEVAKTIEFILSLDNSTFFPQVEIKHIED